MLKTTRGFTLVELLIVIVVIGILAAITLVAYNGITSRANDSSEKAAVSQFQQLLEMYNTENGMYPAICSADGIGCVITTPTATETSLLSVYASPLPSFPEAIQYVRQSGGVGYGLLMSYNSGTCKIVVNGNASWWGSSVPQC